MLLYIVNIIAGHWRSVCAWVAALPSGVICLPCWAVSVVFGTSDIVSSRVMWERMWWWCCYAGTEFEACVAQLCCAVCSIEASSFEFAAGDRKLCASSQYTRFSYHCSR